MSHRPGGRKRNQLRVAIDRPLYSSEFNLCNLLSFQDNIPVDPYAMGERASHVRDILSAVAILCAGWSRNRHIILIEHEAMIVTLSPIPDSL